jgi:[pyruvate, water dikinase]-phosphate phosphotransferase / [pyruvate, water dikinase] kinase
MTKTPPIYIVSGGFGASGEQLVNTILAQFPDSDVPVYTVNHVRQMGQVETAVAEAHSQGGIIVHTLVDDTLRHALVALAETQGVVAIDLMGPLLTELATVLGQPPLGEAGRYRQIRHSYFERIAAIEYTIAHDDGRRPDEWANADLLLIGLSRTGKTPLSIYLSVLGWKVANLPLVPNVPPPPELFALQKERVIGLTIDIDRLLGFRRRRSRLLGVPGPGAYADPTKIEDELQMARLLFREGGFNVINVTDKTIEASADEILIHLANLKPAATDR